MQTMHVVMACDEAYALPLSVTVRSLVAGLRPGVRVDVHVLASGLRSATRDRVASAMPPGRVSLSWYPVERESLPVSLPLRSFEHANIVSYYRLLLPSLLPAVLERVLYLDCDLLVRGDVSELWAIELGEHPLAAVAEAASDARFAASGEGLRLWRDLDLPPDHLLFNAGVMLIDLRAWREGRVAERAFDYLAMAGASVRWQDQEALNAVVRDRWLRLESRWNLTLRGIDDDDLRKALRASEREGCIVHFHTYRKPWQGEITGAIAGCYREQLDLALVASKAALSSWGTPGRLSAGERIVRRVARAIGKRRHRFALLIGAARTALHRTWHIGRPPRCSAAPPFPSSGEAAEIRVVLVPPGRTDDEAMTGSAAAELLVSRCRAWLERGADRVLVLVGDARARTLTDALDDGRGGSADPSPRIHVFPLERNRSVEEKSRQVLHHHGVGHWCVVLRQHEKLCSGEKGTPDLSALVRRLERERATALVAVRTGGGRSPRAASVSIESYDRDPVSGRLFRTVRDFPVAGMRADLVADADGRRRDEAGCPRHASPELPLDPPSAVSVFRFERGMLLGPGCRSIGGARIASFRWSLVPFDQFDQPGQRESSVRLAPPDD